MFSDAVYCRLHVLSGVCPTGAVQNWVTMVTQGNNPAIRHCLTGYPLGPYGAAEHLAEVSPHPFLFYTAREWVTDHGFVLWDFSATIPLHLLYRSLWLLCCL